MSTQASTPPYHLRPLMPAYLRQAQAELSQAITAAALAGNYQLANELTAEHDTAESKYRR